MGRRELLIIAVFAVLGAGAYLAMAPPAKPGERGFSLRDLFQHVRTEMQGESAFSSITLSRDHVVSEAIRDVAVDHFRGAVRVIGEDRRDIAAELKAEVGGPDMREAENRARNVTLTIDGVADAVRVRVTVPPQVRRQKLELTIKAPSRLRAQLTGVRGAMDVRGMAEASVLAGRLDTRIQDVAGAVRIDHREGPVDIVNVGSVHITGRRDEVRVTDVRGDCVLDVTDGRLELRGIAGEITIEARRTGVELRRPVAPVRITAFDARIDIRESRAPLRLEGDRSPTRIEVEIPAAISASMADAPLDVRLPAQAAATLEAVAIDARIRADDFALPVTGDDAERRLSGTVGAGGPLISLRTRRGEISVQKLSIDPPQSTVDRR